MPGPPLSASRALRRRRCLLAPPQTLSLPAAGVLPAVGCYWKSSRSSAASAAMSAGVRTRRSWSRSSFSPLRTQAGVSSAPCLTPGPCLPPLSRTPSRPYACLPPARPPARPPGQVLGCLVDCVVDLVVLLEVARPPGKDVDVDVGHRLQGGATQKTQSACTVRWGGGWLDMDDVSVGGAWRRHVAVAWNGATWLPCLPAPPLARPGWPA